MHLSRRYSESDTEGNAAEIYPTVVKNLGDDNNESEKHDDEEHHEEGAKAGDPSGEAEESVAAEESGETEESGEAEEEENATTSLLPEENASQHGDEDELRKFSAPHPFQFILMSRLCAPDEPTTEGGQGHQDLDQNVTSGELGKSSFFCNGDYLN